MDSLRALPPPFPLALLAADYCCYIQDTVGFMCLFCTGLLLHRQKCFCVGHNLLDLLDVLYIYLTATSISCCFFQKLLVRPLTLGL